MRFRLILTIEKNTLGNRIPMNYQYECSALIYKILSKSDKDFSAWLHENGFQAGNKKFKLFTFSRLYVPSYRVDGEFMQILSDTVEWQISFLPERSTQEFIQGIFQNQTFELGTRRANVRFSVQEISVLPQPVFAGTMAFETLSLICVSLRRENGKVDYLSPDNPEAAPLIRQNLLNKYFAFYGKEYNSKFDFDFEVLSKPKSVLVTIKVGTPQETRVRGFMCRFRMTAPAELMKVAYETGVGEKGSTGFGMLAFKKMEGPSSK
ncbi:MAG: CRISPR-associated endoribonuclease Cas6 [Bacteroidia bacterium]|nr:CRISPR-associated endoribonuclease Cas6 [Bacteroidia bacterium]